MAEADRFPVLVTSLVGLLGAVLGAGAGGVFIYLATDREIGVEMVQTAVGILSAEPAESIRLPENGHSMSSTTIRR